MSYRIEIIYILLVINHSAVLPIADFGWETLTSASQLYICLL